MSPLVRSLRMAMVSSMVAVLLLGVVSAVPVAAATLTASPQNVPFGSSSTVITYDTGGTPFFLFVSTSGAPGAPLKLVASGMGGSGAGSSGTYAAPFITSGSFVFSLRSSNDPTSTSNVIASTTVQKLGPNGQPGASVVLTPSGAIPAGGVTPTTVIPQSTTALFDSGNDTTATLSLTYSTSLTTKNTVVVSAATYSANPITLPFIESGVYTATLTQGSTTLATASVSIGPAIAVTTPGAPTILLPTVLDALGGKSLDGNYVDGFGRPVQVCIGSLTQTVLGGTTGSLTGPGGLLSGLNLGSLGSGLLGGGTGLTGINLLGSGSMESLNSFGSNGYDRVQHYDFTLPNLLIAVSYVHQDTPTTTPAACPTLSLTGEVVDTVLGPGALDISGAPGVPGLLSGLTSQLQGLPVIGGLLTTLLGTKPLKLGITGGGVVAAPGTTIDRTDFYLL